MPRRLLIALVVVIVVACDNPNSPPPPPPPAPATPTVKALTINGRTRIAPGETESYEAIATMSDGTTQVYTTKVQWQTSNPRLLSIVTGTGVATATLAGDVFVSASYFGVRGTSNVLIVPTGTYRLTGKVLESDLPVVSAKVSITAGQGTGMSNFTDLNGDYRFYGVAGAIQIQVTKPGYATVSRSIEVGRDETLDISNFSQTAAPPSLAGNYTLTITVAADCQPSPPNAQFPGDARTRTYAAALTQDGPHLHVVLSGAEFLIQNGRGNAFDGRVEPSGVTFSLTSLGAYSYYYFYYTLGVPDLAEKISASDYLAILGKAVTTLSPSGLTGPLSGAAMVFGQPSPGVSQVRMSCQSSRHQFSLTRQTSATRIRR